MQHSEVLLLVFVCTMHMAIAASYSCLNQVVATPLHVTDSFAAKGCVFVHEVVIEKASIVEIDDCTFATAPQIAAQQGRVVIRRSFVNTTVRPLTFSASNFSAGSIELVDCILDNVGGLALINVSLVDRSTLALRNVSLDRLVLHSVFSSRAVILMDGVNLTSRGDLTAAIDAMLVTGSLFTDGTEIIIANSTIDSRFGHAILVTTMEVTAGDPQSSAIVLQDKVFLSHSSLAFFSSSISGAMGVLIAQRSTITQLDSGASQTWTAVARVDASNVTFTSTSMVTGTYAHGVWLISAESGRRLSTVFIDSTAMHAPLRIVGVGEVTVVLSRHNDECQVVASLFLDVASVVFDPPLGDDGSWCVEPRIRLLLRNLHLEHAQSVFVNATKTELQVAFFDCSITGPRSHLRVAGNLSDPLNVPVHSLTFQRVYVFDGGNITVDSKRYVSEVEVNVYIRRNSTFLIRDVLTSNGNINFIGAVSDSSHLTLDRFTAIAVSLSAVPFTANSSLTISRGRLEKVRLTLSSFRDASSAQVTECNFTNDNTRSLILTDSSFAGEGTTLCVSRCIGVNILLTSARLFGGTPGVGSDPVKMRSIAFEDGAALFLHDIDVSTRLRTWFVNYYIESPPASQQYEFAAILRSMHLLFRNVRVNPLPSVTQTYVALEGTSTVVFDAVSLNHKIALYATSTVVVFLPSHFNATYLLVHTGLVEFPKLKHHLIHASSAVGFKGLRLRDGETLTIAGEMESVDIQSSTFVNRSGLVVTGTYQSISFQAINVHQHSFVVARNVTVVRDVRFISSAISMDSLIAVDGLVVPATIPVPTSPFNLGLRGVMTFSDRSAFVVRNVRSINVSTVESPWVLSTGKLEFSQQSSLAVENSTLGSLLHSDESGFGSTSVSFNSGSVMKISQCQFVGSFARPTLSTVILANTLFDGNTSGLCVRATTIAASASNFVSMNIQSTRVRSGPTTGTSDPVEFVSDAFTGSSIFGMKDVVLRGALYMATSYTAEYNGSSRPHYHQAFVSNATVLLDNCTVGVRGALFMLAGSAVAVVSASTSIASPGKLEAQGRGSVVLPAAFSAVTSPSVQRITTAATRDQLTRAADAAFHDACSVDLRERNGCIGVFEAEAANLDVHWQSADKRLVHSSADVYSGAAYANGNRARDALATLCSAAASLSEPSAVKATRTKSVRLPLTPAHPSSISVSRSTRAISDTMQARISLTVSRLGVSQQPRSSATVAFSTTPVLIVNTQGPTISAVPVSITTPSTAMQPSTAAPTGTPLPIVSPPPSPPPPPPRWQTPSGQGAVAVSVVLPDKAAEAVASSGTAVSALSAVASPVAVSQTGRISAALSSIECVLSNESPQPSYMEHPFQTPIGSGRMRHYLGACVISTVVFLIAPPLLTWIKWRMARQQIAGVSDDRLKSATSILRLLSSCVAAFTLYFAPNVAGSATTLITNHTTTAELLGGVITFAASVVGAPALIYCLLLRSSVFTHECRIVRGDVSGGHLPIVSPSDEPSSSSSTHSTADDKVPASTQSERIHFVNTVAGSLFVEVGSPFFDAAHDPSRLVVRLYCVEDLASAILTAVFGGVRPSSGNCTPVAVALLIVAVLHAGYIFVVRPYRTKLDRFFVSAFAIMQCVLATMCAYIAAFSSPSDERLMKAVGVLVLLQLLSFLVETVVQFFWSWVTKRRRHSALDSISQPLLESVPETKDDEEHEMITVSSESATTAHANPLTRSTF